jgi:hypothetical protein
MIIVGFVLFAAAVVVALGLIVQNPATVTVHAFNQSWDVDTRWLFVAGLALTAIGLLGLGMMRLGGAHYVRLRGEQRVVVTENKRLTKRAAAGTPMGCRRGPELSREPAPVGAARPASERRGLRETGRHEAPLRDGLTSTDARRVRAGSRPRGRCAAAGRRRVRGRAAGVRQRPGGPT